MKEILKYKKALLIITVIIVAFVVYSYLFKKDASPQLIAPDSTSLQTSQFSAGREILALLSDLKSLQLNNDIFSNKAFRSLEDFSLPISSEPKGRNNPFAPIGIDAVVNEESEN